MITNRGMAGNINFRRRSQMIVKQQSSKQSSNNRCTWSWRENEYNNSDDEDEDDDEDDDSLSSLSASVNYSDDELTLPPTLRVVVLVVETEAEITYLLTQLVKVTTTPSTTVYHQLHGAKGLQRCGLLLNWVILYLKSTSPLVITLRKFLRMSISKPSFSILLAINTNQIYSGKT